MVWEPLDVPEDGNGRFTDLTKWRLNAWDNGRHVWEYLDSDEACRARPQTVLDKLMLGLPVVRAQLHSFSSNVTCASFRTCLNFLLQRPPLMQPGTGTNF